MNFSCICVCNFQVRSQSDRKNVEKKGLIWLLDEESTSQSPSQDGFLHRLYSQHADPHCKMMIIYDCLHQSLFSSYTAVVQRYVVVVRPIIDII